MAPNVLPAAYRIPAPARLPFAASRGLVAALLVFGTVAPLAGRAGGPAVPVVTCPMLNWSQAQQRLTATGEWA